MTTLNTDHMQAYANGALDGYNYGENNNPYAVGKPEMLAYNMGFDYGLMLEKQDNLYEQK